VLGVTENGIALDTLISDLAKQGTLTALRAKRARAAAGLRTSAAHARWTEIGLGDVAPVIELMKELSWCILDKEPRQLHSLVRSRVDCRPSPGRIAVMGLHRNRPWEVG
jgi:hypothetical protein